MAKIAWEFFAGGGMARAGLGDGWQVDFANDFCPKKAATYRANWGDEHLRVGDINNLTTADLPGTADLAWASSPCQDFSLAGNRAGLDGERSGTFWPFWRLMQGLMAESRAPKIIVLENVEDLLTSQGGVDFAAMGDVFAEAGYYFGATIVDAALFVPQSRRRVFIIAVRGDAAAALDGVQSAPSPLWHPPKLIKAHTALSEQAQGRWLWWKMRKPPVRNTVFADVIEENPTSVSWHTAAETQKLLDMMSETHRSKVEEAQRSGKRQVGGLYKRTRPQPDGRKIPRAEVRFDEVAGCLRTPSGGSSRQTILVVEGESVRSRLISPRETARLMGLPDDYKLPSIYNDAYYLTGDGVVVPVVRHLAEHIFEPILRAMSSDRSAVEPPAPPFVEAETCLLI